MSSSLHYIGGGRDNIRKQQSSLSLNSRRAHARSHAWQSTVSLPAVPAQSASHRPLPDLDMVDPEKSPKTGSSRFINVTVVMLDDSIVPFRIKRKEMAGVLLQRVHYHLDLIETDYFGLEYQNEHGVKFWLDPGRLMCRQTGLSLRDTVLLCFCVKFYTPETVQLQDAYTRHLFALQIRRDLRQGLLQCHVNTTAVLVGCIIHVECGSDITTAESYLRTNRAVPRMDEELEQKIIAAHRELQGIDPFEAEMHLLETARKCELYGIKMHQVKDHHNASLNLAVIHCGLVVFHLFCKINTFSWAKIRKLSFKRRYFFIKLHLHDYGSTNDTVNFVFPSRNLCKNFWKKCVEHHCFYRCTGAAKPSPTTKSRVLAKGSQFRFSGRTQRQLIDYARSSLASRQNLNRLCSFRSNASMAGDCSSRIFDSHSAVVPATLSDANTHDPSYSAVDTFLRQSARENNQSSHICTEDREFTQSEPGSVYEATVSSLHSVSHCATDSDQMFSTRAHARSCSNYSWLPAYQCSASDGSSTLGSCRQPGNVNDSSCCANENKCDSETLTRGNQEPIAKTSICLRNQRNLSQNCVGHLINNSDEVSAWDNVSYISNEIIENKKVRQNCVKTGTPNKDRISYHEQNEQNLVMEDKECVFDHTYSDLDDINLIPYDVPSMSRTVIMPTQTTGTIAFSPDSLDHQEICEIDNSPNLGAFLRKFGSNIIINECKSSTENLGRDNEHCKFSTIPRIFTNKKKSKETMTAPITGYDRLDKLQYFGTFACIHSRKLPRKNAFSFRDDSIDDQMSLTATVGNIKNQLQNELYAEEGTSDTVLNSSRSPDKCLECETVHSAQELTDKTNMMMLSAPSKKNRDVSLDVSNSSASSDSVRSIESNHDHISSDNYLEHKYLVNLEVDLHTSLPSVLQTRIKERLDKCFSSPEIRLKIKSSMNNQLLDPSKATENLTVLMSPEEKSPGDENYQMLESFAADNDFKQSTSIISDTTSTEDDTTLQYDTVPDDSEDYEAATSEEYADKALPFQFTYDLIYQPVRVLSRISERSTNSEVDSRLSTPTVEDRAAVRPSPSCSVKSNIEYFTECDAEISSINRSFPSPPSTLIEPSTTVVMMPSEQQTPPTVYIADTSVKSDSATSSETCSDCSHTSCSSEAEKVRTTGVESEQDDEVQVVEDLPGDDDDQN